VTYPSQSASGEARLIGVRGAHRLATFTCNHCSYVTELAKFERPADAGAICKGCMKPICLRCAGERVRGVKCDPWDAKLARLEAAR